MKLVNYTSAVYCIYNQRGIALYIGSTTDLQRRFKDHLTRLRMRSHDNKGLQDYCDCYGIDTLNMVPIFYCEEYDLRLNEIKFINFLKPAFNIRHNDDLVMNFNTNNVAEKLKKQFKGQLVSFETAHEWIKLNGYPTLTSHALGKRTKDFKKIKVRSDNNRMYYQF